jgi:hypothetical protein
MKKLLLLIVPLSLLVPISCTDLEVLPTVGAIDETIFKDPAQYKSYLAKVYASFSLTGQAGPAGQPDLVAPGLDEGFSSYIRCYWKAQELTTDEALISWNDGGIRDLHNHSWSSENQFIRMIYYRVFYIVGYANDFLRQSEENVLARRGISESDRVEIRKYRAEARFLRALAYYHAFDFFRNIPVVTSISTNVPTQSPPRSTFDFIESELKAVENELPNPRQNEYGRADKAAVWMTLARLYQNAEVYIGEPRYNESNAEINKVLSAGYTLAANYNELFYADNHKEAATELIFTLPADGKKSQSWGATTFLVSSALGEPTMNDNKNPDGTPFPDELLNRFGTTGAWLGTRPTAKLIEIFKTSTFPADSLDPRARVWREGRKSPIITKPYDYNAAPEREGYIIAKYRNITSSGGRGSDVTHSDIDYPFYRLADAYLMYAENVLRGATNGDLGTALNLINQLRQRAYGNTNGNITASQLTLDFVLDERARELYWEATRRTDLIRYGRFSDNGIWPWKGEVLEGRTTEKFRDIFPIPAVDLAANPRLRQNPGY